MVNSVLRVGLIGVGDHGTEKLLPAVVQPPLVKIVATCDIIQTRAEYAYLNYGASAYYLDYREMLDKEHLDAVIVAVDPMIHYEVFKYAVKRGISIFLEKPPALHSQQMREMAELSESAGITTGVGLNFRYSYPIQMIKTILNESNGDYPIWTAVKHVSSKPRGKSPWPVSFDRAFLLMQAIHPLDTLIYFNGTSVESSLVANKNDNGIFLSCNFRFANGTIGNLITGSTAPNFSNYLEIETRDGKLFRVDHLWNLFYSDQANPIKLIDSKRWEYTWRPSPTDSGYKRSGYASELEVFFDCVRNNRKFSPSFIDVIHHYELMDIIEDQLAN